MWRVGHITAPSLIPTVNGNTARSFSTHGQLSAAQGSSTTVSRSDIRLIQHFDSSALGLVRRWLLNWPFPSPLITTKQTAGCGPCVAEPRRATRRRRWTRRLRCVMGHKLRSKITPLSSRVPEYMMVWVTFDFRDLASAPKVRWRARAGAHALGQFPFPI
jgi:hypothetical protein